MRLGRERTTHGPGAGPPICWRVTTKPDNHPAPAPAAPGTWSTLHLWQIQPLRDTLVILAAVGIIWLGYRLSLVTVPILLALLLAYLVEPLVRRLTRRGWVTRPFVALSLIVLAFLVVLVPVGIGLSVGGMQAATYAQTMSQKVSMLASSVEKPEDAEVSGRVDEFGPAWKRLRVKLGALRLEHARVTAMEKGETPPPGAGEPDRFAAAAYSTGLRVIELVRDNAQNIGGQALTTGAGLFAWVTGVAGSVTAVAMGIFLTAFFFFFFCNGWGRVLAFWHSLIPERRKGPVVDMVHQMDRVIAGFIRGRLTICAILAVHYTVGYWLIGVPAPLILGAIVAVLALLPYIGAIGIPVAITLLLLSPPEGFRGELWWAFVGPLIVHSLAQVLDDYILTPKIQGDTTGMDTPTILFASLAGGILAGFYGLLLAIPVAACIKIVLKTVVWPKFKAWAEGRRSDPLPMGR